jgi:hypothetical protein
MPSNYDVGNLGVMSHVIGILQDSTGDQIPVMLQLSNFAAVNTVSTELLHRPEDVTCTNYPVAHVSFSQATLQNVFPGFSASKFLVSSKIGTYHVVTSIDGAVNRGGRLWRSNIDGTCTQETLNDGAYKYFNVQETIVKPVNGTLRLKVVR